MATRTIAVPPGLGDSCWIIQKLINSGEKFKFRIPGGQPRRGGQLFDLLPSVCESWVYDESINYKQVEWGNAEMTRGNEWASIWDDIFFLTANKWLEEGKRLEGWMPDLPISFRLPWETTTRDFERALEFADDYLYDGHAMIGIYASAYANNKNWGGWSADTWFCLCSMIHKAYPAAVFVIIGASYDEDLATDLIKKMTRAKMPFVNTIGEKLPVVIEMLKMLRYFIGFPSGLSILNETLSNTKTFMFYPPALEPMINTWAEPSRIESGDYKGMVFCQPDDAFAWMCDEYFLFDKL